MTGYSKDLAYIHHVGFGGFAQQAAPALLQRLRRHGIRSGLVVDLGCGSGALAAPLVRARYDVLGVDVSAPMIALARSQVPRARFVRASFLKVSLPSCRAVLSVGECLSYRFDRNNRAAALKQLFTRIAAALEPGGIFICDVLETPGSKKTARRISNRAGADWATLVTTTTFPKQHALERQITSFRRVGQLYRRTDERHMLWLYDRASLLAELRRAGFRARVVRGYGRLRFRRGHVGFVAVKIAERAMGSGG